MSDDTHAPPTIQPLPRWMPFEWLVALRFLREGRVQTIFIIGGVAIGVGVIVFMSALLSGLQSNFVKRVLTGQAHIQLLPPQRNCACAARCGHLDGGRQHRSAATATAQEH